MTLPLAQSPALETLSPIKPVLPEPKKIEAQILPQTSTTTMENEQPTAPAKKVYPKEKHPKVTKSPKFGQRLLVTAEKHEEKPKPEEKPWERKRSDTKPEVAKSMEKPAHKYRKAPEPPVERLPSKPKEKVKIFVSLTSAGNGYYH